MQADAATKTRSTSPDSVLGGPPASIRSVRYGQDLRALPKTMSEVLIAGLLHLHLHLTDDGVGTLQVWMWCQSYISAWQF